VNTTVAIDIMGGDHGPHVFVSATEKILQTFPDVTLILCGDEQSEQLFSTLLSSFSNRLLYEVCEQVVLMTDKPAMAIR
jgi:glycerol-3-phosphate acyltransferase PlsX